MHLGRFPAYWAKVRGDALALAGDGDKLNWRTVNQRAGAIAAEIQRSGIGPGGRVACLMSNSLDWCLVYYGTLISGATFVPLNTMYGPAEIARIVEDAGVGLIFADAGSLGLLPEHWQVAASKPDDRLLISRESGRAEAVPLDSVIASGATPVQPNADPSAIAVIGYTSGTTGLPKGVVFTHANIFNALVGSVLSLGWTYEDKFLVLAPLAFTGGYNCCLSPALVLGASAYVEPVPDVSRALDLIVEERVTVMQGVPHLWDRMSSLPGFSTADLTCIKTAVTGGSPVPPALLRRFHEKGVVFVQGYGCTESAGSGCVSYPELALSNPEYCGPVLPGLEIELRGDDGQPVQTGEVGEICLRGPQIMAGYWGNAEATAQTLKDGWLHTGDVGQMNENGAVQIKDRKKNMIISGGVNIYPAEIERYLLSAIPGAEAVVLGIEDADWGERVVALLHTPEALDLSAIMENCRQDLGRYKCPREIIQVASPLPKTNTGKVSRQGLADFYAGVQGEERVVVR